MCRKGKHCMSEEGTKKKSWNFVKEYNCVENNCGHLSFWRVTVAYQRCCGQTRQGNLICLSAPAVHVRGQVAYLSKLLKVFVRLSIRQCVFVLAYFVCIQISFIAVQTQVGQLFLCLLASVRQRYLWNAPTQNWSSYPIQGWTKDSSFTWKQKLWRGVHAPILYYTLGKFFLLKSKGYWDFRNSWIGDWW